MFEGKISHWTFFTSVETIPVRKDKRGGRFVILMNYIWHQAYYTCREKKLCQFLQFSLSLSHSYVFSLHWKTLTTNPFFNHSTVNRSNTKKFCFRFPSSLRNRTSKPSPTFDVVDMQKMIMKNVEMTIWRNLHQRYGTIMIAIF